MKGARVRTESMVQKLAKQPMSEGFVLMDKQYLLGAMRLLTVKAENSPPFQLGPCLEAIANICAQLKEAEDAVENYGYAAEKFDLIMQPVVANIMRGKAIEQQQGTQAALNFMDEVIKTADPENKILSMPDGKPKEHLARAYHFRSELKLSLDIADSSAIDDAQTAAAVGWDRGFLAHYTLGLLMLKTGDNAAALAAFSQAASLNNNFVDALDGMLELLNDKPDQWLATMDKIIALHPRAEDIRAKAFKLSELQRDAEALALLDQWIASPPQEEAVGRGVYMSPQETKVLFLKSKAIIYADQGNFADAKTAAQQALEIAPGDAEVEKLLEDILATESAPES